MFNNTPRLIVLVALLRVDHAVSQLLSAYDQAYGRWRATLRKGFFRRHWSNNEGDLQLLFPANNNSTAQAADLARQPVSSVTCDLSLERNGRFCLALSGSTAAHPLRGEYYLTPNPYCVTDRWYDELLLESSPRMRRLYFDDCTIVERATVQIRCRITGRYGSGSVRAIMGLEHGRCRGRMTHGAMLMRKEREVHRVSGETKKAPTERKVIGTFSALPIPVHSNVELEFSDGEDDDSVGDNFDGLGTLTPLTDNI
mmetsp:Transcript_2069/g.4933  ORF Transcript_2069/g.4933 Transcript_2069/m.4933 type:complete len:255 (-) Transcript_2069:1816-2580(-)